MARLAQINPPSGYTILLVDDNAEYLEITRKLLQDEGHQVIGATNGPEALAILRQYPIDLLLLDYFMPRMTGEEVILELRRFNPYVQVILQTGYASERPPREMLRRLDIQGYFDKSEGHDKLLLWVDAGLKSAYTVQLLYKSRQGLRYILEVTPDLHKIQPIHDLLQGVLWQVAGLVGATNSFLAVLPEGGMFRSLAVEAEGFVAMFEEETELVVQASTGRFTSQVKVDCALDPPQLALIAQALRQGEIQIVGSETIVPLRIGERIIGVIYLDRPTFEKQNAELLSIFANQAAVAIQNSQLYEMAALDHLTGVFVRGFLEQSFVREARTAFRSQTPLALLMVDLDDLKYINDTAGHLAGDGALATVGKVLRDATRTTDIIGRYGGDEFAVILPQARLEDAGRVCQRIFNLLQERNISNSKKGPLLQVSIGLSGLAPYEFTSSDVPRPIPNAYFQQMAQTILRQADAALYQAKRAGKNQLCQGPLMHWPPLAGERAQ